MATIRIYELAAGLKKQPKEILDLLSSIGISGKVAS